MSQQGLGVGAAVRRSFPSEDREAWLFWALRSRIARTHLRQTLATARLRTSLVLGLSLLFWCGLFALFYAGFTFINTQIVTPDTPDHPRTIRLIFHLFFASLNVMLVFSTGVIMYSTLFRSPETRLLLTLPVRAERIVLHRFQEALFFSTWGFFLLASPMLLAYGIVAGAPWYYYALILPMIFAFVYIPCALGAIACLLLVAKFPRLKLALVAAVALAAVLLASQAVWTTFRGPQADQFGTEWFKATVKRFEPIQEQWLPSTWLCSGLLEAARLEKSGDVSPTGIDLPAVQSCLYLAVLISNALVLHLGVVAAGHRWLRPGYSSLSGERSLRKRTAQPALIDRFADTLLQVFPARIRFLLLKDWRVLRRDPVQWTQFLIFFGLLGLYFLNIDRFSTGNIDINYITWVNFVSFLNLAVVGLILSTFTTRFIYPMISLEGQRFWILGLMPIRRELILWSKFVFASLGSWIPSAVLVLLSDLMLQVSDLVIVVHQLSCLLLSLGLSSIAVGLGAIMPDFRETSPSKIAAGFGGTLNLVLSALYVIAIVTLVALPCHFYLIAGRANFGIGILDPDRVWYWLVGGMCAASLLGSAATIIPMRLGLQKFAHLEVS